MGKGSVREPREIVDALHFRSGSVLADLDPGDTSLAPGDRARTEQATADLVEELTGMQERLYAEGVGGGHRSLLLLLQGMDTSGKDGTVRRVVGAMNPAGVRDHLVQEADVRGAAARLPLAHRERPAVCLATSGSSTGRSTRTSSSCACTTSSRSRSGPRATTGSTSSSAVSSTPARTSSRSCCTSRRTSRSSGSRDRLDDPTKHWKYNVGDLKERAFWDDYQAAYQDALARCSTDSAPWYVVPADHKWCRDWLVANLLVTAMRDLNPVYPPADFDVAEQRRLVAALD